MEIVTKIMGIYRRLFVVAEVGLQLDWSQNIHQILMSDRGNIQVDRAACNSIQLKRYTAIIRQAIWFNFTTISVFHLTSLQHRQLIFSIPVLTMSFLSLFNLIILILKCLCGAFGIADTISFIIIIILLYFTKAVRVKPVKLRRHSSDH